MKLKKLIILCIRRICRLCIFKEYENISSRKNVYIYVSSELVDYVFSTMRVTTFRFAILHIVWTIWTIDGDLVDRIHNSFADWVKTFITENKEYVYVSGWINLYIYLSSEIVDYYVFSTIIVKLLGMQFRITYLL